MPVLTLLGPPVRHCPRPASSKPDDSEDPFPQGFHPSLLLLFQQLLGTSFMRSLSPSTHACGASSHLCSLSSHSFHLDFSPNHHSHFSFTLQTNMPCATALSPPTQRKGERWRATFPQPALCPHGLGFAGPQRAHLGLSPLPRPGPGSVPVPPKGAPHQQTPVNCIWGSTSNFLIAVQNLLQRSASCWGGRGTSPVILAFRACYGLQHDLLLPPLPQSLLHLYDCAHIPQVS